MNDLPHHASARFIRRLAICATFATLMHGGLLGGLITMAPYPLYTGYRGRTELWELSLLEDQQLAGLLMWVPMGVVYLGACLMLASRLVASREGWVST
jgi:putative membrane protein